MVPELNALASTPADPTAMIWSTLQFWLFQRYIKQQNTNISNSQWGGLFGSTLLSQHPAHSAATFSQLTE